MARPEGRRDSTKASARETRPLKEAKKPARANGGKAVRKAAAAAAAALAVAAPMQAEAGGVPGFPAQTPPAQTAAAQTQPPPGFPAPPPAAQTAVPRFDPYTGKERPWRFDPYTGKPISAAATTLEAMKRESVALEAQPLNKSLIGGIFVASAISLLSSVIWVEKASVQWFDGLFPSIAKANEQMSAYEEQEQEQGQSLD